MSISLRAMSILPLLVSSSAFAAISGPFTTSTPIPATTTDWTNTLAFPKFNSALGTLTSVEIKISADITTVIKITNNSASPSNGNANTEAAFLVQDAGNNFPNNTIPYTTPPFPSNPTIDLLSPAFNYNVAAGGNATSGNLTKSGNSDNIYNTSAILAEFTGPGTITLNVQTITQTVLANTGGNTIASQVTQGDATGNVTYTFTSIPEPASIGLLGLGVLSLIARRRGQAVI